MTLIAICPACNTHFSVVPDQLKISEGWVRCGKCHEVFDAIVHSSNESGETFHMPLQPSATSASALSPIVPPVPPAGATTSAASVIRPFHPTQPSPDRAVSNNTDSISDPPSTIDLDIDSSSPYMSVGDVLDSITPDTTQQDDEQLGFVQRWLLGRQSQPAPLEPSASTYPTIEAKESQQQELVRRKSEEQPVQRIQSVLETLEALRRQHPSPSPKPTYADPQPTADTGTASSNARVHSLQSKLNRVERTEPSFQVREKFPWSASTAPAALEADSQRPASSAAAAAGLASSFKSSLPPLEDMEDTRPPVTTSGFDSTQVTTPASGSDFARSLKSRALRVQAAPQPAATDSDTRDGTESTMPSELADEQGSTLEEKISAVQIHTTSTEREHPESEHRGEVSDHSLSDTDTEDGAAATAPEKEPAFVRSARRNAFWQSAPVRAVGYTACLLAGIVLLLQYAHLHRNRLAVQFPAARSALQQLCDLSGCQLAAWRQIQSINVESSDFTLLRGENHYRMTLGLRNRSHLPIAAPWIELTLTDSQDKPIVRRPFSPYELGIKSVQFQPGTLYEGDVLIDIDPKIINPRYISGYRVLAFYP